MRPQFDRIDDGDSANQRDGPDRRGKFKFDQPGQGPAAYENNFAHQIDKKEIRRGDLGWLWFVVNSQLTFKYVIYLLSEINKKERRIHEIDD